MGEEAVSEVVSLWGQPTGERTVQPHMVEALEALLEMARSGEIVGGVFAVLHCDGAASYRMGGQLGGYSVLGAFEAAKANLVEIVRAT